jgi:DNA repair exonuclease SbcCD ATPase subunit
MADTAQLNQLLQEAAHRAGALAEQAQEAIGVVDELAVRADALAETLADESADAHREFAELLAKLEAADDDLDERAQRARDSLQSLPARTESARGRIEALLSSVRDQLADLKSKEDDLSAQLDRRSEATQVNLAQLAEQARTIQAAADAQLEPASGEVERLQAVVVEVRGEIRKGTDGLLLAMDALQESAGEQVQRFVEGMGHTLTAHTTALFDLEHRLKDAHNDAVVALRKNFAEEVVSRLPAAAASLKESLESLATFCGEEEGTLVEECTRLLDRFELAMQSAQRSQERLQAADRLA